MDKNERNIYNKVYREKDEHKDKMKAYQKKYRLKNKDKTKEYRLKNKDKLYLNKKASYEKNKPKPEDKYKTGKIYKIVDNTCDQIYIGSTTCRLNYRFNVHKYYSNKSNSCSSSIIIKNNDYTVELIEDYPCNNEKELLQREQYHLDLNRDRCVNKRNAIRK